MKRLMYALLVLCVLATQAWAQNTFTESTSGTVSPVTTFSWTPPINGRANIKWVMVRFSQPTNENIDVWFDSQLGPEYDVLVSSTDSTSMHSFLWQPDNDFIVERGDDLNVQVATGSGGETFTVLIRGEYR
jgi:hypothetical protein